jgi:hypothetical protein
MNENTFFNIERLRFLLLRQLRFNTQTLLVGFGAVVGLIVFILSMSLVFGSDTLSSKGFFHLTMPFLFIGGYIFTSTIFSELRTPDRSYLYLTLPASTFEKLIVSWFITSVLYIIVSLVVMYVINILLMIVAVAFTTKVVPLFNLFETSSLRQYGIYIVTQSVFFLGAIYFRRTNFLKTLLSIFLLQVIILIYTSLVARMIVFHNLQSMNFGNLFIGKDFTGETITLVAKILFWYCMTPFFLLVSYFRLKERQV